MALASEQHFTIGEIAELWRLSTDTVREIFRNEPGVFVITRPERRGKQKYTTVRVPQSVMESVWNRMQNRAA